MDPFRGPHAVDPLCSQSGKEPEPAEWEKKVAGDVASATFVFFFVQTATTRSYQDSLDNSEN